MTRKILVSGVAIMDFIMNVEAMPTRAEKYRARDATIVGGGCGANAAVAIVRLGAACTLAARFGDDEMGEMIVSGLSREGVDCTLTHRIKGCRSGFSSVFVDPEGERLIVNYRDLELPAEADWLEEVPFDFDGVLADTRWPEGATIAMKLAKRHGVPGVIDGEAPFDGNEDALQAASHVVFSATGLRAFSGVDDLDAGLRIAFGRLSDFVGVTDGGNDVRWCSRDGVGSLPAYRIEPVDTLGAGDVWHGAFTLALSEAKPIGQAVQFANAAAALKCTRPGGRKGTPARDEIEEFMRSNEPCS